MLRLIQAPVTVPNLDLPVTLLRVQRLSIAKRTWRGVADDGLELGFALDAPLKDGDTVFETPAVRYVVQQQPEAVIEISLDLAPSAAAGIGWAIGNLHLELSGEATRLLAPDEPAVRQLLARLKLPFTSTTAIFRPGHFVRGNVLHELGRSHQH